MAPTTTPIHRKPSFLGLPAELRLTIYEHVLAQLKPEERWVLYHIHLHVYDLTAPDYLRDKQAEPGSLGIMRTCSQVYEEASDLLFASTKVTACIRPLVARAWSKSSTSLGLVGDVRLWHFVRDFELTIQLERKLDVEAYLSRISNFIEAFEWGKGLRKLNIVLQLGEDDALPAYTDQIVEELSKMAVSGDVTVRFNGDIDEAEGEEICLKLRNAVTQRA